MGLIKKIKNAMKGEGRKRRSSGGFSDPSSPPPAATTPAGAGSASRHSLASTSTMGGSDSLTSPPPTAKAPSKGRKGKNPAPFTVDNSFLHKPGRASPISCFHRGPTLETQLLGHLGVIEEMQPVGAFDLVSVHQFLKKCESQDLKGLKDLAREMLEGVGAEALLRCYMALLDPVQPSRLNPKMNNQQLKSEGRKADKVALPLAKLLQALHYFRSGANSYLAELSETDSNQARMVYLWSNKTHTEKGAPTTRMENPIDIAETRIAFRPESLPQPLTPDQLRNQHISFFRDLFDYMLQTLEEEYNPIGSEYPHHPSDAKVTLRRTADILFFPLPVVHAVLPNPWIDSDFSKQVLSILTFFKLLTVRDKSLGEIERKSWPRDTTARGFNIFGDREGPNLIYQQCGVRIHLGDRAYARDSIKSVSAKDLQLVMGQSNRDFSKLLSDREIRHVLQVIDFPFALAHAFLLSRIACFLGGEQQSSRQVASGNSPASVKVGELFVSMSSVSCLNARFFAVMEVARTILGILTPGECVQRAYSELLAEDPSCDDLSVGQMTTVCLGHLRARGMMHGWDKEECCIREISPDEVSSALGFLGFE